MSIDSLFHKASKVAFSWTGGRLGGDSGPRQNGTRYTTHQAQMQAPLRNIPDAADARFAQRKAASTHRDAMKASLAAIPSAHEAHAQRVAANNHRTAMKPLLQELPQAVAKRQASATIGHFLAAKIGAQRTNRNIAARMQYNQSEAGKAAIARDAAAMSMIIAGGTSWNSGGLAGTKISVTQQVRSFVGRWYNPAAKMWQNTEDARSEARDLHHKQAFSGNKELNQSAQSHIAKAGNREIVASGLGALAAPVGMAVSTVATPAAGVAANTGIRLMSAGALHLAANQRGLAAGELNRSALDRKDGGGAHQKEISYMRSRGERKLESDTRDKVKTTVAGALIGGAGDLVDLTGTVSKTTVNVAQRAATNLVNKHLTENARKYGYDEQQTDLGLQNQLRAIQAASKYQEKIDTKASKIQAAFRGMQQRNKDLRATILPASATSREEAQRFAKNYVANREVQQSSVGREALYMRPVEAHQALSEHTANRTAKVHAAVRDMQQRNKDVRTTIRSGSSPKV